MRQHALIVGAAVSRTYRKKPGLAAAGGSPGPALHLLAGSKAGFRFDFDVRLICRGRETRAKVRVRPSAKNRGRGPSVGRDQRKKSEGRPHGRVPPAARSGVASTRRGACSARCSKALVGAIGTRSQPRRERPRPSVVALRSDGTASSRASADAFRGGVWGASSRAMNLKRGHPVPQRGRNAAQAKINSRRDRYAARRSRLRASASIPRGSVRR